MDPPKEALENRQAVGQEQGLGDIFFFFFFWREVFILACDVEETEWRKILGKPEIKFSTASFLECLWGWLNDGQGLLMPLTFLLILKKEVVQDS